MRIFYTDSGATIQSASFKNGFKHLQADLINVGTVDVGEWQSQSIDGKANPMVLMKELLNVSLQYSIPESKETLAEETGAHLPWAEDHFQERVSGQPLNPPPSNEWWPFAQKSNADHKSEGEKFSHTYPERMWPKYAEADSVDTLTYDRESVRSYSASMNEGIRFYYGDLNDVVKLLHDRPMTRQAYLPIWFPEDTGVVHGRRVPCTLGYHFIIRDNEVHIAYYMRSCDLLRHFQDDVYMAGRLLQWVCHELNNYPGLDGVVRPRKRPYTPGNLTMHIANLHVFNGDVPMMEYRASKDLAWNE